MNLNLNNSKTFKLNDLHKFKAFSVILNNVLVTLLQSH